MSQATGHTNPLDAAREELNNRHTDLVRALTRVRRSVDTAIAVARTGGDVKIRGIHQCMSDTDDLYRIYLAVKANVRDLEEVHTLSEH